MKLHFIEHGAEFRRVEAELYNLVNNERVVIDGHECVNNRFKLSCMPDGCVACDVEFVNVFGWAVRDLSKILWKVEGFWRAAVNDSTSKLRPIYPPIAEIEEAFPLLKNDTNDVDKIWIVWQEYMNEPHRILKIFTDKLDAERYAAKQRLSGGLYKVLPELVFKKE